jgi:hypothetical protein
MALTDESVLDLARQLDPRLARPRAQIAKRMARTDLIETIGEDTLETYERN